MLKFQDLTDSVAYFRVSTQNQADEYHSTDYYLFKFRELGFEDSRIYYDVDSGANNQRRGYQLVLGQIRTGQANKIVVPDFTRFTRSPGGWEDAIKDFQLAGAKLITLDGAEFKLDTPENLYTSRMLVANAAYVREQNQYKSLKGYEFGRLEGRAFQFVFGYLLADGKLTQNTNPFRGTNQPICAIALELIDTFEACTGNLSETLRTMTRKYGVRNPDCKPYEEFSRDVSGLAHWLSNPALRGHIQYFRKVRPSYRDRSYTQTPQLFLNTHEALMSEDQWLRIDALLKRGKGTKKAASEIVNPLQGLMFCAGCGEKMRRQGGRSTPEYRDDYIVCGSAYPLTAKKRMAQEMGELLRCDRRSSYGLKLPYLEETVIKALCTRAAAISAEFDHEPNQTPDNPEVITLRLQIHNLENLATTDLDILPLLETKRQKLLDLQSKSKTSAQLSEARQKLKNYGQDPLFWNLQTKAQRMALYREFIESIQCDKGEVTISFRV